MAISLAVDIHDIRSRSLEQLRQNARNVAITIIAARAWNSKLDGVYAVRSPLLAPNPYLKHPHRDISAREAHLELTMVNPAYMTRMISDILSSTTPFRIGLRSMQPLNPGNLADTWESHALETLDKGSQEVFGMEINAAGAAEFRYMLPVTTDESCLNCHEAQGSWIGELRGGLSVIQPYPTNNVRKAIAHSVVVHLLLFGTLGTVAISLLRRMENCLRKESSAPKELIP